MSRYGEDTGNGHEAGADSALGRRSTCPQQLMDREDWLRLTSVREEKLSRPKDLLLDLVRRWREEGKLERSFPVATGGDFDAKKENIKAGGVWNDEFLHKTGAADELEALIRLLDKHPRYRRARDEAMTWSGS